jgi:hypothetical protein
VGEGELNDTETLENKILGGVGEEREDERFVVPVTFRSVIDCASGVDFCGYNEWCHKKTD